MYAPGDRNIELGGRGCPTDAATRAGGLCGVVEGLEGVRCDCECEWECDERGVGLVAVLITIVKIIFLVWRGRSLEIGVGRFSDGLRRAVVFMIEGPS